MWSLQRCWWPTPLGHRLVSSSCVMCPLSAASLWLKLRLAWTYSDEVGPESVRAKFRTLLRRTVPELLLILTSDGQIYHKVGMAAKNALFLKKKKEKIHKVHTTLSVHKLLPFWVGMNWAFVQPALSTAAALGIPASQPPIILQPRLTLPLLPRLSISHSARNPPSQTTSGFPQCCTYEMNLSKSTAALSVQRNFLW